MVRDFPNVFQCVTWIRTIRTIIRLKDCWGTATSGAAAQAQPPRTLGHNIGKHGPYGPYPSSLKIGCIRSLILSHFAKVLPDGCRVRGRGAAIHRYLQMILNWTSRHGK